MLIVLPIYLQLVLEYNALEAGLTLTPLSLTMFGAAVLAGKRAGKRRPADIVLVGFALLSAAVAILIALVPRVDSGWSLAIPLALAGAGLGLVVSQLNNYALSPISEERVGEAAGVTSTAGSFGSSFGLAFAGAIMLATLSISFTHMSESSSVLPPADQQQIADVLEHDAQVMSDAQLQEQIAGETQAVQDEVLRINTDARHVALQVALLFTLVAALGGVGNAFRMRRLQDPAPSSAAEAVALG
jgi:Na+/melibiose symporter-like transporter